MAVTRINDGLTNQQRYRNTAKYKATRDARTKTPEGHAKAAEATKKSRAKNIEQFKLKSQTIEFKKKKSEYNKRVQENPELRAKKIANNRASYQRNKESILAKMRDKYHSGGKENGLIKSRKRRSQLSFATPKWANKDEMKTIYANRGMMHVDHIIPLRGKLVCGLHCAANLQYLDGFANKSKLNKFDADTLPSIVESMAFDVSLHQIAFNAAMRGTI